MNNLINIGEINGIIGRDEYDRINLALIDECRIEKITDPLILFNEKVKSQLHIILALSPVGD